MKSNTLIKFISIFLFATQFIACGGGGNNTSLQDTNTNQDNDDNTSTDNNSDLNNDGNQDQSSVYSPYGSSSNGNTRLKKITTQNSSTLFYYESTPVTPKIVKTESTGPGQEKSTTIFEYDVPGFRLSKIITDDTDSEGVTSQIKMTTGGSQGLPNGPHYNPIGDNTISTGNINGTSCKAFSGTYSFKYELKNDVIQSQAGIVSKTINMDHGVIQSDTICEDTAYTLLDTYTYDNIGRLTKETTTLNEDPFSEDVYEYDSYHRVTRITTSVTGFGLSIKKEYTYVAEPIGSFKLQNEKEYSYVDLDRDNNKEWNIINTSTYEYEEEECFIGYIPFEPTEIPFLRTACVF